MMRLKQKSEQTVNRVAVSATRAIGSTSSLVVHTILFLLSFSLYFLGFNFEKILLIVTTIVSLEAIYLSIFIQMSVNKQAHDLNEVAQDVEEIQEDVEEIQEDVEGIEKDVDEIQEDVEEIQEEDEKEEEKDAVTLTRIESTLEKLMNEIAELRKQNEDKK